jgi:Ran GTPase-activating protein (RanGAP) involved in mRNA processing and transport
MTSSTYCPITHPLITFNSQQQEALNPLLEHLRSNRSIPEPLSFPLGTIMPDGRLDLCKQNLGIIGCESVTEALKKNTQIISLLLGTNGIGNAGVEKVADLIEHNSTLKILYLGCNQINTEGITTLANTLKHNRTITALWLKRNPLGDAGINALISMLRFNHTSIRTLDLVNTGITTASLTGLLEVLTVENSSVERLYLGGNNLTATDGLLLGKFLQNHEKIKALMLNVNQLGDAGIIALTKGLQENQTLVELGLNSNGITAKGVIPLLKVLTNHPTLTRLELGYSPATKILGATPNIFGDLGMENLGDFFTKNTTLNHLNLRGHQITETGKMALIKGLEHNTSLCKLALDGKPDPRIVKYLERNQRLNITPIHRFESDVALIQSVYR